LTFCRRDNNYHVCETSNCGGTYSDDRFAGGCDANGCDYNPYRMGNTDFYGKGLTVDTSKKFTVVSQFSPDKLTMFFIQNGQKIEMPAPKWEGIPQDNGDLTPAFCSNAPAAFGDRDRFEEVGGFSQLNAALQVPMVLVMSIWDDVSATNSTQDTYYCTYSPPPLPTHTPRKEKGKEKLTPISTTRICFGSTPSTPLRRRASPVPLVVLVLRTLVSPPRSKPNSPTRRLSIRTSASVPSARLSKTSGRHHHHAGSKSLRSSVTVSFFVSQSLVSSNERETSFYRIFRALIKYVTCTYTPTISLKREWEICGLDLAWCKCCMPNQWLRELVSAWRYLKNRPGVS